MWKKGNSCALLMGMKISAAIMEKEYGVSTSLANGKKSFSFIAA